MVGPPGGRRVDRRRLTVAALSRARAPGLRRLQGVAPARAGGAVGPVRPRPAGPQGAAVDADHADAADPPPTAGRSTCSPSCGRATCWCTTPTTRSTRRWWRSSTAPRATRTSWRSSRRCTGRRGRDSPIVRSLIRAANAGKQVVALVELKARFDEEANINWAQRAGGGGRPRRVRVGGPEDAREGHPGGARARPRASAATSTSAPATTTRRRPRIYEDVGLLSADRELGLDVSDLFNFLTGYSHKAEYRRLLVAPLALAAQADSS